MRAQFDSSRSSYPITARYAGPKRWKVQDIRTQRDLYDHEFTIENAFDLAARINAGLHSHPLEILVTAFAPAAEELKAV